MIRYYIYLLLVCINHVDLRGSGNDDYITKEAGENLRSQLKAFKYVECSAKTQTGLKQVFDAGIRSVLMSDSKKSSKKNKCLIL